FIERDRNSRKPEFSNIYIKYSKNCYKNNAMDFDDLLIYTNILLRDNPSVLEKYQHFFDYILVDEYQDTNYAQYLILNKLSSKKKNLCVVGDDAQSIYSFRGAKIENILNFKNDYPGYNLFKLERNYRSTKNILEAANSVIKNNARQIPKKIWTDKTSGNKIRVIEAITDGEEGYLVAGSIIEILNNIHCEYSDFAVLYRTNAQSRIFEEAFRKKNIPYKIYGGLSFYQRKEIKDILAYMRLIINFNDNEAIKRIINYPARSIGKTTLDKIEEKAIEQDVSIWEIVSNPGKYNTGFNSGTTSKLLGFSAYISDLSQIVNKTDAYEFALHVAKSTGILKELMNDKTPESLSRYENIQELLNGIKDFSENLLEEEGLELVTIEKYIENVALITNLDSEKPEDRNKVSLMTIHSAKGLEFQNIFIVGVEEELFPSPMNSNSKSELEEERRLFYVAITRAKENLSISYAKSRYRWGNLSHTRPSRFLSEIDTNFIEGDSVPYQSSAKSLFSKHLERNIPVGENVRENIFIKSEEKFIFDKQEKIQTGMNVLHQKFGKGKVIQIEGNYPDIKATVFFINFGQKKLLLKFAQLKIIK
ncbi:MAG: 3'-5' exonuclease, partial [Bacteroidota bacterium]